MITSDRHRSKTSSAAHDAVRRQPAAAEQLVGPAQQEVAEQDRRGRAVLLRVAAPAVRAVLRREAAMRGRPTPSGVGGVHVVVVHQRARVEQLERGAGPDERVLAPLVVRRSRRRRGTPSSRTPPGTACPRDDRPGLGQQPSRVVAERREPLGLLVEEARRARPAPARGTRPGPTRCRSRGEPRECGCQDPDEAPVTRASLPRLAGMPDSSAIGQLLRSGERSFSFEFFPPKDADGEERALALDQRARAPAPHLRLGHLRRGRHHPRAHGRHHPAHRRGDLDAADGAPDLRRAHPRRADDDRRRPPPGGHPQRAGAARRPSGGPGTPWESTPGGLEYASDLVAFLQGRDLSVGVAAFPEGHRDSPDLDHDARVLKAKYDAGAEFAITEMVLRADDYTGLVRRAAEVGADFPIVPGHHADPEPRLDAHDGAALRARDAAGDPRPDPAARGRPGRAPGRGDRDRRPSSATTCSRPARRDCTSTR